MIEETIAAIATPVGVGAISIIRVSGTNAVPTVDFMFKGKIRLENAQSHSVHYGKIFDKYSNLIDEVLVSVFKAPHSYTGENSVEISTHGNPLILEKILENLIEQNIRLAEPGEFTKRAFLNGKIDLTQAEAVIDVISSRTEASLNGARNQLNGLLSQKVAGLRADLIYSSSFVELELDFAEEDVEFIKRDELINRINLIITEIDLMLKSYSFGKVIRDGVNVAIIGAPNVGKSSILNYIVKEARAIVSEIPGTTRDVIKEDVSIDGILFRLFDTAGLRISDDTIEREGISRSLTVLKDADIILAVTDEPTREKIFAEIDFEINPDKIVSVLNKIDIVKPSNHNFHVLISAKTGEGMTELFKELKEKAIGVEIFSEKTALVTNIRHFKCLSDAKKNLENSLLSIKSGLSGEFIAQDLREAENFLNEIIGVVTSDDILNNIFRNFCIGK